MSTQIPVVDLSGKEVGNEKVSDELFAITPNENAVHAVCKGQMYRFYKKTATTKGRSEVSGGGRKSRKQKGTGGARHGGNRANIFVGGGVVFGPQNIKREYKVNKKLKRLALASVLSDKVSGGQIRLLKAKVESPKTQPVCQLLKKLSLADAKVALVVDEKTDANLIFSARNISGIDILPQERWTTLDLIKADSVIFSESGLKGLAGQFESTSGGVQ